MQESNRSIGPSAGASSLGPTAPIPMIHAPHSPSQSSVNDEDSLFEIIWRRRLVVAVCTAVAVAVSVVWIILATRTYTATASLYVEPGGQGLLSNKVDRESSDNSAFLFTQQEVVASTPVVAAALSKPGMLDLKTFAGQPSAFAYVKNNLDVEVGKKDELITISFESPYPAEATQIVSAIVDAYRGYQSSQQSMSASGAAATLTAEKEKSEKDLADKIGAMQAFAEQHDIVGSESDRSASGAQTLNSIAASITAAHLDVMSTRARLDAIEDSLKAAGVKSTAANSKKPDDAAMDSAGDEATIRAQLIQAQSAVQELTGRVMPDHPLMLAAKQRVEDLTKADNAAVSAAYAGACKQEADLHEFYAAEQHRLVDQDAYAADYARMQAGAAEMQKMIDSLDSRIRELGVSDEGAMATVSVLEPARAEDRPTGPKKTRLLAFGLLAGLMLGAVAACVRDRLDTRLTSIHEIRHHLGLLTLAVMPTMRSELAPTTRALQVFHDPESPFADACRALRTTILFGASNHRAKTILITSPSNGDGRTTVAANLAISMAQVGRKVLLIDADLRTPMQDWVFGVKGERGLAPLLAAGKFDPKEVPLNVQDTIVPHLQVMASGGTPSNPAELFNSKTLLDLLDWVSQAYDHVIIDTPPSRSDTDARIIASSCDVTLLVLCLGKHNRNVVAQTRDDLTNVGANVVGAVLNNVSGAISDRGGDTWRPGITGVNRGRELMTASLNRMGKHGEQPANFSSNP